MLVTYRDTGGSTDSEAEGLGETEEEEGKGEEEADQSPGYDQEGDHPNPWGDPHGVGG